MTLVTMTTPTKAPASTSASSLIGTSSDYNTPLKSRQGLVRSVVTYAPKSTLQVVIRRSSRTSQSLLSVDTRAT